MQDLLCPHWVFDDYSSVTPEFLQRLGVRLLLSDLDFTLAPKKTKDPDETVRAWLQSLKDSGVQVVIVSNNRSPARVERYCRTLGIRYVGHAQKPLVRGYRKAMAQNGAAPGETAMLGDKLLTDMLAANRAGVLALMVEPVGGAVTAWQRVLHGLQSPFKAACRRRTAKIG